LYFNWGRLRKFGLSLADIPSLLNAFLLEEEKTAKACMLHSTINNSPIVYLAKLKSNKKSKQEDYISIEVKGDDEAAVQTIKEDFKIFK